MLLDTGAATETNCTLTGNTFSIKASPIAFDILSAKLYSNPMLAIIRELLTNAYDSHIAAGKEGIAIDVEMPTHYNPHMRIRDYGIGLCKDDVLQLYTTFFDSTKSTSNNFTGCFGLGSKTPFAYTSSFAVNSYYEGKEYKFVVTKKDGYPSIFCVSENDTEKANGLEIIIPVQEDDYSSFKHNLTDYMQYMPEIRLNLIGHELKLPRMITSLKNVRIYEPKSKSSYYYNPDAAVLIKQGQNVYDVSGYDIFEQNAKHKYPLLKQLQENLAIVIEVPIGTFSITPSRENLSKDDGNTITLDTYLCSAERIVETILSEWTDTNESVLTDMCVQAIESKYLSEFNEQAGKHLQCRIKTKGYEGVTSTINSSDVYIHRLDYQNLSLVKHSYFTTGKNLVILVPNMFKYHPMVKLCNTLANYPEFKQYDRILLAHMPRHNIETLTIVEDGKTKYVNKTIGTAYNSDEPIISVMRKIYNAIYLLNNLPKYNFDIEITSITKLYRTYTNHAKAIDKATVVIPPTDDKNFRFKHGSVRKSCDEYMGIQYEYYNIRTADYGREESLGLFNKHRSKTRNLIIAKEDVENFTYVLEAIGCVENIAGENIFAEYISRQAVKAGLQEDFNLDDFHVITISKANLKYFKNYIIYRHDDFMKYLKLQNFTCKFTQIPENIGNIIVHFNDIFMNNAFGESIWTPRQKQWIENSYNYKRIMHIGQIIRKGQFRPIRFLDKLRNAFYMLGCEENLIITNLGRWTQMDLIRKLNIIMDSRRYCSSYRKMRNSSDDKIYYESRYEFSRHAKLNLLQLLIYGKVKYAVLQN